ncbi:MAG: hypothetical protein J6Y01_00230, partial [Spirochaetales bacterium]|nr:hypothetical protein [Spirochaetales bacterium]
MAKIKFDFFKQLITNQNNLLIKTGIMTVLLTLFYLIIMFSPVGKVILPPVGSVIENDIVAKTEIRYLNMEETHKNIAQIKEDNVPIFRWDNGISSRSIKIIANLFEQLPLSNTDIDDISQT